MGKDIVPFLLWSVVVLGLAGQQGEGAQAVTIGTPVGDTLQASRAASPSRHRLWPPGQVL